MTGPSPRYLAEHLILPRFLKERGAADVFAAFARGDRNFFDPVWAEAGFRFLPRFDFGEIDGLRLGLMTLPTPRDATEAYFAVLVGRTSDPALLRCFLWEKGDARTVMTEWREGKHLNYGEGPPFTGDWGADGDEVLKKIYGIVSGPPTG
jgi:hypothetical protein